MFLFSVRSRAFGKGSRRFVLWVLAGVALASAAVWVITASLRMPSASYCEGVGEYSLVVSGEEEREAFFSQFGYTAESLESYEVTVPSQGEALQEYNEIQKAQGLNILPYGDKPAQMYVFELKKGQEGAEPLYGFLLVYRDRVIGAHVSDCVYPAKVKGLRE